MMGPIPRELEPIRIMAGVLGTHKEVNNFESLGLKNIHVLAFYTISVTHQAL